MRRRREYLKATQFDSEAIAVKFFVIKNESGSSDITSSEIIDFAAKLFHLASKRGRIKLTNDEVFDEAV